MGVTLGDSIVGISVLSAIKKKNPKIKIKLIRPETAPSYVEELYELASSVIDELHYMPFHIQKLPCTALNIDVGNQLYSPDFHIMEMHDYFICSYRIPTGYYDRYKLYSQCCNYCFYHE